MATHWADHADWNALDRASIAKVTELLSGKIDLGGYGLGRERSLADYQEWAGIDFNNKTIKAHAKAGIFGSSQIILKPETKAFARISSTKEEKADIAILTESQCRHGIFTYPSHDTYIGACLSNYGEWGEGEVQLLSHYLSEGSTAIEIGSNLGTHTIPMARMVGPSGRILAYEPQRLIFQLLCHNLIANRIFNVQAFNAAAGARSGSAIVPDLDLHKPNNFGGTRIHAKSGLKTEIKTLDDISLQSLSLIKIDAEDCESEILLGAINTIDQHRPAILLEYNPGQQAKINRILRLFNQYRFFAFTEPLYNPDNYNSNPNNLFPRVASHGLIACKDAPPSDLCNRIRFREVLISRS
jgi:FkbM family methyltransferase